MPPFSETGGERFKRTVESSVGAGGLPPAPLRDFPGESQARTVTLEVEDDEVILPVVLGNNEFWLERNWQILIARLLKTALLGFLMLGLAPGGGQETLSLEYEIVQTYPHDPAAFSQGLFFRDGFLYESTGRRGQSSLRKVDLESGSVLQEVSLPTSLFGEGIAPFEDKIYQLTWQSGIGLIYDTESFESEDQFRYAGEGWGLAQDGRYLIMSNGSSSLYFLDPASMRQVGRLQVYQDDQPVSQINELEYIKGFIYANVWHGNEILKISPNSGRVVARIDLSNLVAQQEVSDPEAVLNGIAYDAEMDRIFVTGKLWPSLYEIRLKGEE